MRFACPAALLISHSKMGQKRRFLSTCEKREKMHQKPGGISHGYFEKGKKCIKNGQIMQKSAWFTLYGTNFLADLAKKFHKFQTSFETAAVLQENWSKNHFFGQTWKKGQKSNPQWTFTFTIAAEMTQNDPKMTKKSSKNGQKMTFSKSKIG